MQENSFLLVFIKLSTQTNKVNNIYVANKNMITNIKNHYYY